MDNEEMLEFLLSDFKEWIKNPENNDQGFVMYTDSDTEETSVFIITVQKGKIELA